MSRIMPYPTLDIASARSEASALGHTLPTKKWSRVRSGLSYVGTCQTCGAYALVLPVLLGCWRAELSGPAMQYRCPGEGEGETANMA